jgi:hypothetical protein
MGDLAVIRAVGFVVHLAQNAPRPDPRIGFDGKRAAESRYRRHRRLLLHVFVMRGSKNSGGELVS